MLTWFPWRSNWHQLWFLNPQWLYDQHVDSNTSTYILKSQEQYEYQVQKAAAMYRVHTSKIV